MGQSRSASESARIQPAGVLQTAAVNINVASTHPAVPSNLSSEKACTAIVQQTAKTNKPSHVQERLELEISILQGDLYGLQA